MTVLEISQIIFNLVISFAVIIITVFLSIIAYDTIKFIKSFKLFLNNLNKESSELYNKINAFLENIFSLSFISKLLKKKKKIK